MGVGDLQLSAESKINAYIIDNPEITFFKNIHSRYTYFSQEISKQPFTNQLDFGIKSSCDVSKNGDLMGEVTLVIELPEIPQFKLSDGSIDEITKFAWCKKIGYRIVNTIELVIDNQVIDTQYGEMMNIEQMITSKKKINSAIGNISSLTKFTNGKKSYKLMIPLQFWFTKSSKANIPLVCLNNNSVSIKVELNSADKCFIISPSHYIFIDDDLVNFKPGEYIIQTIDGIEAIGKFEYFDMVTRKLYYLKVSDESFASVTVTDETTIQTEDDKDLILYKKVNGKLVNEKYFIRGLESREFVMPQINSSEIVHSVNKNISDLKLKSANLLINYTYLTSKERNVMKKGFSTIIEQTEFTGNLILDGINQNITLNFAHPCKQLFWLTQLPAAQKNKLNDWDNYSNDLVHERNVDDKNIITNCALLYDGEERFSMRNSLYFDKYTFYDRQTNIYEKNSIINTCHFSLNPESVNISGTANFSAIENVRLKIQTKKNTRGSIHLRSYAKVYNVLKFKNGTANLVFSVNNS